MKGRKSYRRYLANASLSDLLQMYANSTTAARRAVLRQLRLVNESLAELDAIPPHPTVDDLYLAAARSHSEMIDPTVHDPLDHDPAIQGPTVQGPTVQEPTVQGSTAQEFTVQSPTDSAAVVNATPLRPTRMRPPTASGWLPPLLHRHRRWAGSCVDKSETKLTAWLAEPGKQVELPCVTWYVDSVGIHFFSLFFPKIGRWYRFIPYLFD